MDMSFKKVKDEPPAMVEVKDSVKDNSNDESDAKTKLFHSGKAKMRMVVLMTRTIAMKL